MLHTVSYIRLTLTFFYNFIFKCKLCHAANTSVNLFVIASGIILHGCIMSVHSLSHKFTLTSLTLILFSVSMALLLELQRPVPSMFSLHLNWVQVQLKQSLLCCQRCLLKSLPSYKMLKPSKMTDILTIATLLFSMMQVQNQCCVRYDKRGWRSLIRNVIT